jgi:acetyl-CoA carboxylase biotin carboxylase subunit
MAFGDGTLYLERYVSRARHVEVQILADQHGNVRHLAERDCSAQRRHQKLVEEGPAPNLPEALRDAIRQSAVTLAQALDYEGAGTVEFLVDVDRGDFVFLEVNARVQVEHPVTEMITGVDIVRHQLRIADGQPIGFSQDDVVVRGHAIECRVNAEDVHADFRPSPGRITRWVPAQATGLRVDTFAYEGASVSPYYDSMVAKVIAHGETRDEAIDLLGRALAKFQVEGVPTTIDLLRDVIDAKPFRAAEITTRWLEEDFLPGWTGADR